MDFLQIPLFRGLDEEAFLRMQTSRYMRQKRFAKNEVIFHTGDLAEDMGVVLAGKVMIENSDVWGNRSILSSIGPGQVFAETYALSREPMLVDVYCAEDTEVLLIDLRALLNEANGQTAWYSLLMRNVLELTANKNLMLSHRIVCTTPKSVRGRLLTYLSAQAVKHDSKVFAVPFNRQQMADYLNLDRSALSKELSRMREEGLLDFHKNQFTLIHIEE